MTIVRLSVPFESLLESVTNLSPRDKLRLWRVLNEQIAQWEEEILEEDPLVRAEIQEAREAYLRGDYLTLDEYIARLQQA
ncbi:MAG: hypothetical protein J7575_05215 [Chloroflexi bacterium]|jgi:hypothetical protein|nr:hypothetical protein [Chloroflexota bacterium]